MQLLVLERSDLRERGRLRFGCIWRLGYMVAAHFNYTHFALERDLNTPYIYICIQIHDQISPMCCFAVQCDSVPLFRGSFQA
jgi:hypothetical protein